MKGIRFYADLPGTSEGGNCDPRYGDPKPVLSLRTTIKQLREYVAGGKHLNCVALLLGEEHRCADYSQECLSATFWHANSDTSLGSVSREYLRKCRRIPESLARQLHSRLFVRLDSDE